ncbi:DNA-directed RNA polymerase sigma-70 factor [Bryobacterales bacterium F-183]|nr:DNA-directed RNA polymerase sigma-70 factor [Bryobacterales bacterium F-183]
MQSAAEFEDLRPQLFALAYRMLGTRADAEDIVQDAFLRWQAVDPAEVRSAKSYLYSIVARLSLDALKSARHQRETYVGTWLPEPLVTRVEGARQSPEGHAELADSLSIAFLHVLESLSPPERIAFLMREVFDADYADIAQVLETSEANCRQLVTRARKQLGDKRSRFEVDPERHKTVLQTFLAACETGDTAALLDLMRGDAILYSDGGGKASAAINPIYGADRISRFMAGITKKSDANEVTPVLSGGLPAVVFSNNGEVRTLLALDLDTEGHIRTVYIVRNPDKLPDLRQ